MAKILNKQKMDPTLDVNLESAPGAGAEKLQITTTRFGALEVDQDLVLTFPEGLIGFESCRSYVVVHQDENSAFRWLQSLQEPAVAFPIMEPRLFRPDYRPTISDADARFLELDKDSPTLVFVVVTVPASNPRDMTANLLGPLVINGITRKGKQVIIQDEGYTARHRVLDELLQRATGTSQPEALVPGLPAQEASSSVQTKEIARAA